MLPFVGPQGFQDFLLHASDMAQRREAQQRRGAFQIVRAAKRLLQRLFVGGSEFGHDRSDLGEVLLSFIREGFQQFGSDRARHGACPWGREGMKNEECGIQNE